MRKRTRLTATLPLLLGLALTGAACGGGGEPAGESDAAGPASVDSAATAEDAGRADTAAVATGTRAALPSLFSLMLGLQGDLDGISHGLWTESYDSIAAAAQRVADHPRVTPEDASMIAGILGADMARFQALDGNVHDLSVELAEHARARDFQAILDTEARLRAGCVECHTTFRDRLREGVDR